MATPTVRARRWSRVEYERLVDLGVFRPDERLELLDGVLMVREPQDPDHATAILALMDVLRRAFGPGWNVRPQLPVALDDASEPEPDVCVVRGTYRDYRSAHPTDPVLLVEITGTRVMSDRRKGGLYARAGRPEYWIVNLRDRVLEVYRRPTASAESRFGWVYAETLRLAPGERISPLAAPDAHIAVDDLLP